MSTRPADSSPRHKPRHKRHNPQSDKLEMELDQIGLINLNYLNLLPNLPNFPNIPKFELGRIQEFPKEFSAYVSRYIHASEETGQHDQTTLVNSIKTTISTRIQMNNFLNDLNLGLSITTAIERLQPLTDIINETISLPVEDEDASEEEEEIDPKLASRTASRSVSKVVEEDQTEPVGVRKIVNSDQPLINQIIKPEYSGRTALDRLKSRHHCKNDILSTNEDSGTAASDLDIVEGLSVEQVRALTDLDSPSDFKDDLLRKRIQTIQSLGDLSQKSKNKLVTRLMMGNYYKYTNGSTRLPSNLKQSLVFPEKGGENTKERGSGFNINTSSRQQETIHEEPVEVKPIEKSDRVEEDIQGMVESEDEVMLTENDLIVSYHDKERSIMGCPHYQRNCKVECPTCFKWFPCRFCHDAAVPDHKLVRSQVKHILCMFCNTPQVPESELCINCEHELANYFCSKCVLYDNDTTKDIYHCDKCGICRLGLGIDKDYFHCDTCNICLSIDLREKHRCLTNTTHCNCPICNEYLFTSVNKVVFMKCGHSIHQHCYDELVKHSYKCPICKKTVVNVEPQFRILDQEILQSPLPVPYNTWRCIVSCNDCQGKSNVPYHVLGLKCKYCKSYNTNQLKLIKPEEEEDNEDNAEAHVDMDSMRLVQTNLSSNFRIGDYHDDEEEEHYGDVEEDEEEGDDMVDIGKISRHLNDASDQSNLSYITSIFQNFINSSTKE